MKCSECMSICYILYIYILYIYIYIYIYIYNTKILKINTNNILILGNWKNIFSYVNN